MLEALFALLFKYRPIVFSRADFAFAAPWPVWLVAVLGLGAGAWTVFTYARAARGDRRDRTILAALRLGALATLVFALAGPVLLVATVVPQQNFLAILLDDSRSMRIADEGGRPRADAALATFAPDSGRLTAALGERFKLRWFRFAEQAERLGPGGLTTTGRRTDIAAALDHVRAEMAGLPLAGIVVVSDGGDNGGSSLTEPLLQLQATRVPVHTVGLGAERLQRDLEVQRAETPRTVLRGSAVTTRVWLTHTGLGGRTVQVVVEDEGRIVATEPARLTAGGDAVAVPISFTAANSGARRFRFRVAVQDGEQIAENNAIEAVIQVADRREKILYVEGEPRYEVKFLRRALTGDANLHVTTLLRTAEGKFLRLDVDDSTEVAAGFPVTREELYRYRGLILGSFEASAFTHDQLQMLADFVNRRGGGLLALGGRRAFAEGGYAETPVAEVLPVTLDRRAGNQPFFAEIRLAPTAAGRDHPVTQLRGTSEASAAWWDSLPPLSTVNPITGVKPGASVLLEGRAGSGVTYVAVATQRFGRGRTIAVPVQDLWQYQMSARLSVEDQTQETLWRQLLRWLVSGVPEPVMASVSADRVEPGRPVTITATVQDSGYVPIEGADVTAVVSDAAGVERTIPLAWTGGGEGEFRGTLVPQSDGMHQIRVEARRRGTLVGTARAWVEAGDLGAEAFGAGRRTGLLRRVADETGGRFYTSASVASLPEDVGLTEAGVTVREQRDLWDMPVLFLLFVTLIGAEWAFRRVRGLA